MNIVFIHGRDQQGKISSDLEKIWADTLRTGLEKSQLTLPAKTKIIFPYYGDKLDALVQQANLPDTIEKVIQKGLASDKQLSFLASILQDLSNNAELNPQMILDEFEGSAIEKGVRNWAWIQAILRALDKHTSFGNFSIQQLTYDVYMYLTKPGIAKEIDNFVLDIIGNEPCVVVAHSLGSIIGYNVLKANPQLNVKSFVTMGSPLGLKSIKTELVKPLAMPACIENTWFNAYDDKDVVALNSLSSENFDIEPEITNYSDVKNQTKDKHGIEGYLNDVTIAKFISEQLTPSSSSD